MAEKKQPLVSVPVITYNSAKFVLETLESIKAQTYQNIELIISDDCSTDNTVELCQKWVEENKDRFVRTQIITVDKNTGVSANFNRAEAACQGEWVKPIAGDDVLMPDCIESYIVYINADRSAYFIFSKHEVFGENVEWCNNINHSLDFTFYNLSSEEQLQWLVFEGNQIAAITFFYNKSEADKLKIVNDERIPLLEDWPKWINILEQGGKFNFLDKLTVCYRIGDGISTTRRMSLKYYESLRLMHCYYLYPRWIERGNDYAIHRLVEDEVSIYKQLLELEKEGGLGVLVERDELLSQNKYLQEQLNKRQKSLSYRLGYFLLHPISSILNRLNLK